MNMRSNPYLPLKLVTLGFTVYEVLVVVVRLVEKGTQGDEENLIGRENRE